VRAALAILAALLLALALSGCFSVTLRASGGGVNGEIEFDFRERAEANDRPANAPPAPPPAP